MSTAAALAVIDRLCADPLPGPRAAPQDGSALPARGGREAGGAPRYHLAELPAAGAGPPAPAAGTGGRMPPSGAGGSVRAPRPPDDGGADALRPAAEEQCEAERDALVALLARRWGEPWNCGLGGVQLRALEYREEIPEPWASLSDCVPDLHLWHTDGRWIGLGVARLDPARPPRVLAVATDVDPP